MADPGEIPTATAPEAARVWAGAASAAPFTPGAVLGGRYRIIALLGRGAMGEVYRADDLKLGQPVALKFLPRDFAAHAGRFERFVSEVRLARQVSHPNICRVHDIAEVDGQQFLSMEYVDGEDLRSLLQRIGRLPADKALEIARQLSAGLAAAHDRGVLHRDLKPANVMLDGRGRVRITDFGLAVAADAPHRAAEVAGTPAYMAPEQFAGQPASVQSDIYSLGVLLYELYTGTRALPAPPSAVLEDIDPAVEDAILRATARDPKMRPPSVAHLLAMLPGGSPLEAALRAGETPSPEMVAASGAREGMRPAVAMSLLTLIVLGTVLATVFASRWILWRRAAPEKAPAALVENARAMLAALGHETRPADHASGLEADLEQLRYLQHRDPVHWRSTEWNPNFLRFWYRQSPRPLETWRFPLQYGNVSRVTPADPPHDVAGMSLVRIDPAGRLTQLLVVPTSGDGDAPAAVDWNAILRTAGFDVASWRPAAAQRTPPVYADARAAWEGTWPGRPDLPVRLEAAAMHGKAVYFEAVFPWTPAPRTAPPILTAAQRVSIVILFVTVAATLIGAAVFARRHVRAGRSDRRGAARLATFVFVAMIVSWFFGESHVATLWEVALLAMAVSWALLAAALSWVAYLAVEPFVRRHRPEALVSWTRLLRGDIRDPLVGRDLLIGCAVGPLLAAVGAAGIGLPERVGLPSDLVFADVYGVAYGVRNVVPLLVWRGAQAVLAALLSVFVLSLLRVALRAEWAAIAVFVVGGAVLAGTAAVQFWIGFVNTAVLQLVFALLLVRFGLLAAVAQFYVWGLFIFLPVTANLEAWYGGEGLTSLLVLAALALFGFTSALGRRQPAPHWSRA